MNTLQECLEKLADYFGFDVRSYSGRGMYGKTCLAIVGEGINLISLGYALGEMDRDIDKYDLDNMRSDSMGLGMVYYWPNIEYENK